MTETALPEKKKRSLSEQGAWLLAARVIGFSFSVALPLLLVRRLSQEEFGLYKQAFLIIVFAATVLPLGFQMSAFYFLPRETDRRRQIIFNILLFNFAVGLLAFLVLTFAPQVLGTVFHSETLLKLSPTIGAVILLWIFSTFLDTVAVANQEPRAATAFIVLSQLTKTILLVGAGAIFGTVASLVYAALAQAVLQTIVLLVYLNSRFPRFWLAFDAETFRRQTVYALPLGFAGLLWGLQLDLHNFFVSANFTPAEFAIYATGCFQLPLVGMLSDAVGSVLIPRMSELENQNKPRQMIELTATAAERLAVVFFPLYVFLMIAAESFVVTLFTDAYAASVPIFQINLTLLPFYVLSLDAAVRAHKDLGRQFLVLRIFIFLAMAAALWFGVKNFSLGGMIAIVVVTGISEKIITATLVGRKLGFQFGDLKLFKNVFKIAAAALLAGAPTVLALWLATKALPLIQLIVCAAVFAPVYLAAIHFFNAVPETEKQRFFAFLNGMFGKFRKTHNQKKTVSLEI